MATEQTGQTAGREGYDDLLDTLACRDAHLDLTLCADLVDRLEAHDVTHLGGGSADAGVPSPYRGRADVDLEQLIRDLARAPEPRLRDALIALLLRHPEAAVPLRRVRAALAPDDPARASLTARLLVAAALQRIHQAALMRDLPGYAVLDVTDLVQRHQLPAPEQDGGWALLRAAHGLVAGRLTTIAYVDGWEDVARHSLRELHGSVSRTQPRGVE